MALKCAVLGNALTNRSAVPSQRRCCAVGKRVALTAPLISLAQSSPAAASSEEVAESVKTALEAASALYSQASDFAVRAVEGGKVAVSYVQPYADIAAPVVRGAAQEAAKVAGPLLQSGVSQLKSSGVDVQAAAKAVSTVAQEAAPTVTAATNSVGAFLAGTEPSVLVLELLSIAIILAVTPAVAPFIATLVRGYASDVSPLVALEMLTQDAMLVDLRKESEADIRGVPSLPRGSKGVFVACPMDTISDRALRSAISDPTALEAESTARIIASLKKASRSRRVILLDSQSSQAKLVARKLTSIGFSRVSVVEGGFDAWARSGLASRLPKNK